MRGWVLLTCLAACRPVMAPRVPAPASEPSAAWESLLGHVVTVDGQVDYDRLEAHRGALDDYVAWIAKKRTPPRSNQRHAFLLNVYNALVLYQVLERGRPDSVMDVKGWIPEPGAAFFYETAFMVDGTPTSLHEIEDEYLRFKQLDYRDHAAMNCASRSCPPLRSSLYDNNHLDKQLKEQMMRWVADDARGVRIDEGVAVFSPIFDWYAYDFDFQTLGDDLCTITARFASGAKKLDLRRLAAAGCPHRFAEYDWSLNDASGDTIAPDPSDPSDPAEPSTDPEAVPLALPPIDPDGGPPVALPADPG